MKILAIDDNPDNLTALGAVMQDALPACMLLTALNGPCGLELALAEDPDVILLDIVMPGMDGYEVCRQLKADDRLRPIPVVFLTALRTDRESRIRALEIGAEAFLSKPFDEQELVAEVRAMAKIKAATLMQRDEHARLRSLVAERTRELRQSEERFRALFEQAPLGYQSLDAEGRFIEVNQAWLETLGYLREEAVGKWFGDFLAPEFVDAFRERFPLFKAAGHVHSEFQMLHKDGERRFIAFEGRIAHTPDGGFKQTHCILQDITERKRAEEALRALSSRQEAILSAIPDIIMEVDCNKVYRWANQPGFDFFGEDVIGKEAAFYFAGDDPVYSTVQPLFDGDENVIRVASWQRRKDGEKRLLDWSCRVLKDLQGHVTGALSTAHDITERMRLEEALEKRLLALTSPLDQPDGITFEDLFELDALQRIQDEFAAATGVASVITRPDGTPLTRPSNFTRLCKDIIRGTETGCRNCLRSDALLGTPHPDGPVVQPCLSGGLWDAGASICVGDRHIANWLIGQVRDETQSEDKMREYARTIGADEAAFIEAFREVPVLSIERFRQIAQALFSLAKQLSVTAYQNIQQARFITECKRTETALRESEARFAQLAAQSRTLAWEVDAEGLYTYVSDMTEDVTGYRPEELVGRMHFYDLHPVTGREAFKQAAFAVFERKEPFRSIVNAIQRKDGPAVWVATNGDPLLNADGILRGYRGSDTDITERQQAGAALREKLAELERVNTLMIGRENRMIELKREINDLCGQLKLPKRYSAPETVATEAKR
jgi:PAS domain S-box-containing protein